MKGKKVLVFGMARSGVAAAKLLEGQGAEVHITDAKPEGEFKGALDELKKGAIWHLGEAHPENLLEGMDMLVISPGIPIDHPAILRAKELGVEVIGEVELAYRASSGTLVAVTGTNGKTTTCTLLGEIFKNAGKRTFVVGNIGNPYSAVAAQLKSTDVTVCEISSFQMESAVQFHPDVCAVLNISEDHLNRHGTMENYIALKERIFANCAGSDGVVLNYDDPVVRGMAQRVKGRVVWFSAKEDVEYGAFVRDGMIVFGTPQEHRNVCAVDEIFIPGRHNLQNAMAASAAAMVAGVPAPIVRHTLRTFKGVEHRIEFVREVDGVRFINDSKGTNVDSSIWAVRAMKRPAVLIAGGYDKHTDFTPLCEEIVKGNIKWVVLIGDTAEQLSKTLEKCGFHHWEMAGYDFEKAIKRAYALALDGGSVLLSPACASFDMFDDYEARGRIFKQIVATLEPRRG